MRPTLLFGDSLTAGRIGIAYRSFIPMPTEAHGIEGDTWSNVAERARRMLAGRFFPIPVDVVVQGGANDLLIPHMSSTTTGWNAGVARLTDPNHPPIDDDDRYLDDFSNHLETLLSFPHVRIVVCSLPILGENLDSLLNGRRRMRNRMMAEATIRAGATWCDIAAPLEYIVGEGLRAVHHVHGSGYLPPSPESISEDVRQVGTDEQAAARLSLSRGLHATIDGVHPNGAGAQAIAQAVTGKLSW